MEKTINTIEELQNLVALMQKALEFYANKENYKGHPSASTCGTPTSLVEMDEGFQAQFALNTAQQITEQNQKMQNDYDKLVAEGLSTWGEVTNVEDIQQIIKDNAPEEDNLSKMRRK
jgi:hypothetical protein